MHAVLLFDFRSQIIQPGIACLFGIMICSQACTEHGHSKDTNTVLTSGLGSLCAVPQKITSIDRDHVYDLSGYADEGGGDPFSLFDENAFVDPRNESKSAENYIPVTNPQPKNHPEIYFPLYKGSRIVVDLQAKYFLSEVYIYDRSHASDSVWIYVGNMMNWKLALAFESGNNRGSPGWKKFSLNDSAKYLMVRFSSPQTEITEMTLYGCLLQRDSTGGQRNVAVPTRKKIPMKDFLGVNYVVEFEPQWIRPFHYSRLYNVSLDFDNDTVHAYPNIVYNMLHYGSWDPIRQSYHFLFDDVKKVNQGNIWFSLRGVPMWMNKRGYSEHDRPVTLEGMDPENPLSYGRHAEMMWHMAAFFGRTPIDTHFLHLSHQPKRSGLGSMTVIENGNEEDAWWVGNKYCSPLEYFAQSSADYDGNEKKLGERAGLVNADPKMTLMCSGMVGLDTNRVKVYKFLCNQMRGDKAFIWQGGIQYHYYANRGGKGISPEDDSLRWKLKRVREATYRIDVSAPCILGEIGYDKNPLSPQGAPALPGLTGAQSQSIFILRSINATAFSGFDAFVLFWLRDEGEENAPGRFATCGILGPRKDGRKTVAYPAWYSISTLVNRLANYFPDQVVQETGKVWIYKYRNQSSPDSVAYFIYSPTADGSKVNAYALHVGTLNQNQAFEINFTDDSPDGSALLKKSSRGLLEVNVEEKPKLILAKEETHSH